MTSLIFFKNDQPFFRYPITKSRITIGRGKDCDIVLTDEDISRTHCEINKKDGKLEIKDLSKNGIDLNGKTVKKSHINIGDLIRLGYWIVNVKDDGMSDQTTAVRGGDATKIISFDSNKKILTVAAIEITVRSRNGKQSTHKFKKARINIGSADTNDIVITDDDYISKKHCRLSLEDDKLHLVDLGSTNRTIFEGEEVGKVALPKQAEFIIGTTTISVKKVEEAEKIRPAKEMQMGHMIGVSDAMKEIFALTKRVAPTEATVCITGESGTGKELVARSIHDLSNRARGPFVAINCGAIPSNIIESELFGHEKGAFTGASQIHRGVFEQATGGTLFLDEIGEMPAELQTRLLRVLETKTIRHIGGHRDIPVDVRIVAATNQDLKDNVTKGKFREDLFFRLYIIPIHIPPLRDRKEDIKILVNHFTKIFSPNSEEREINRAAIEKLMEHNWAGNVRELKNTIQRAVIMNSAGSLTASDISITNLEEKIDIGGVPLANQEREAIVEALKRSGGNQSKAAKKLGIARTTFSNKLKKFGLG